MSNGMSEVVESGLTVKLIESQLAVARRVHHESIRRARARGVSVSELTGGSTYSTRQSIYDVLAGRK